MRCLYYYLQQTSKIDWRTVHCFSYNSSVSFQLVVESILILISEGAQVAPATLQTFKLIVRFEEAHAHWCKLIVGFGYSETSFHLCKDFRIFREGVKDEQPEQEINDKDIDDDTAAVNRQFVHLVGCTNLVGHAGLIGLNVLVDHNGLVGCTNVSPIGIIVRIIGLVGHNGLVGFIGLVGHNGFVGRVNQNGLVGRNNLVDHIGLVSQNCIIGLINLADLPNHWLIGLIGVIGFGLIASSTSAASLARRLLGLVSLDGLIGRISLVGFVDIVGLSGLISNISLVCFIGLGIVGFIGLKLVSWLIGLIGLISLSLVGIISLVGSSASSACRIIGIVSRAILWAHRWPHNLVAAIAAAREPAALGVATLRSSATKIVEVAFYYFAS